MGDERTATAWVPVAPFGASSGVYRALQRRAGILSRRQALEAMLLEEGLGRRLLLMAPPGTYGETLAAQGWVVTRPSWPPTPADVRAAAPAGPFDAVAIAHGLG